MLFSLSYDRPVITHQSLDTKSGKSVYGPTRGGWLLTIVGQNFGNFADGEVFVLNALLTSSYFLNNGMFAQ